MNKQNLTVEGMSCNHCKMTVEKNVGAIDGVKGVEVNLDAKSVSVEFDDSVTIDAIKKVIDDSGYTVV